MLLSSITSKQCPDKKVVDICQIVWVVVVSVVVSTVLLLLRQKLGG